MRALLGKRSLGLGAMVAFLGLAVTAFTSVVSFTEPLPDVVAYGPAVAPEGVVAVARGHRRADIGERVVLDASASFGGAGERLRYQWSLTAPEGSGAQLSDANSPRPEFVVDLLGDYVATLIVSDDKQRSQAASVTVSTTRIPRHALRERVEHFVPLGGALELDARRVLVTGSQATTFAWYVDAAPVGSRAVVSSNRTSNTRFAPDLPGTYHLRATAKSREGQNVSAQFVVRTGEVRPAALLPDDVVYPVGADVLLAPVDDAVARTKNAAYRWQLRHAPATSDARLDTPDAPLTALRLDRPGLYVVQFEFRDGDERRTIDTQVIEAVTAVEDESETASAFFATRNAAALRGGSDIDGDGVPDDIDNCVETFNPDQRDTNNDGFGNICDPDLDNDGLITNTVDLGLLRLAFFSRPGDPNWNPDADFNGDGIVNVVELGILRNFFFNAPGPIANTFINAAGGSWHEPTNWSLGFVPNAAHAVRIDLTGSSTVEFSTGDTQISSIRTTSPLVLSGGTLNVTRLAEFNDTVEMDSGFTLENAPMIPPTINPAASIIVREFASVTLDGVILANAMTVRRGGNVTLPNDLLLDNVTITLESDGNFTDLEFTGAAGQASTLGGVGEVEFAGITPIDNRNRVRVLGANHGLNIGPNITVRAGTTGGEIDHSGNNGPVTVAGTIIATVDGAEITVDGLPLAIDGSLTVGSGAAINLLHFGVGGTFGAQATASVTGGELALTGAFVVDGNIDVTDGVLDLGDSGLEVWDNNGAITLINSTVELGGAFDAAAIGNLTGTGTTVIDGALDNAGQTLNLGALVPGAIELAAPGRIVGGSVIGDPLTLQRFETFTLEGVTLTADVFVDGGATLRIEDDLTLATSTITMLSDGNFTNLELTGDAGTTSLLGGTGDIVFDGTTTLSNRNRVRVSGNQHGLIVGPGVSIGMGSTGGTLEHDTNTGPVTIQGNVAADIAGRSILMEGAPLRIESSLSVSNDSLMTLAFLGSGGVFASTASATVNTGELEMTGEFLLEGSIVVNDGVLDLGGNNSALWDNDGSIVLNNGTVQLGGSFDAAAVGNLSGTGTVLIDGTLDNVGQTLDLSMLLPGTLALATPGRIVGGTVVGSSLFLQDFETFVLEGVTLASDVMVGAGATLRVENDLVLSGSTITLQSNGNFTSLEFVGTAGQVSMLSGNGTVQFGGTTTLSNRNRIRVSGSQHGLDIAPTITLRMDTTGGEVSHSSNNGPVTVAGPVIANIDGRSVRLSGAPLSVTGDIDVTNNATALLAFTGAGGGMTAGATATVDTGELALTGQMLLEGTISVTDGVVDIGTTDAATWDNDGSITLVNATAELGGSFDAAAVGNLTGTGTTVIDGEFDNVGQTVDLSTLVPGIVELASPGRIIGGVVGGTPLTLQRFEVFTLDGVTLSVDAQIEAGATLRIENDLVLDGVSVTFLSDGNFTTLEFPGVAGDVASLSGNGELRFAGTTTISNRNRVRVFGSQHGLNVGPDIVVRTLTTGGEIEHASNNGPLTIQGAVRSDVAGRTLRIEGGPLVVEGDIDVSNDGIAQADLLTPGSRLAVGSMATVNTGELALTGPFLIEGSISVTDGTLDLGTNTADLWDNDGSIVLTNATLELGGVLTAAAIGSISGTGTTVLDGTFDNTGQTVDLGALLPGTLELAAPGRITAGTITGTPLTLQRFEVFVLDAVTLAADVVVDAGATLRAENGLTLSGATVSLQSDSNFTSLELTGPAGLVSTLGGTGEVVFDGSTPLNNRNRIRITGTQHGLNIGAGIVVRTGAASGEIDHASNNGPVTIAGTVRSSLSNRVVRLEGSPLAVSGTLDVGAGADIAVGDATLQSSASLDIDLGGTASANFGQLTSTGTVNVDGTLNVALVNGYAPTAGDAFDVLTFVSSGGTFATENLPGAFAISYEPAAVTLSAN